MNRPDVTMGVCNVIYAGVDLGHTKGGVKLTYKVESETVETDQSDAPVDVIITKQPVEVSVPMVDYQLEKFMELVPSASLIVDKKDPLKKRLEISGRSGGSLAENAKKLVITPLRGGNSKTVTIYHAVALPDFDLSYEKGTTPHIYNVKFQALAGADGYIAFGDPDADALNGNGE